MNKIKKVLAEHFGVNEEDVEEIDDYYDEFLIRFYRKTSIHIEVVKKKSTLQPINCLEIVYHRIIDSKLFFRIM